MKKVHALLIAALLAVSAGLGLAAATRTAGLRTATSSTPTQSAAIAARSHRLDRVETALRRALRDKPPALPVMPAAQRPVAAAPVP
jgi:nitrate reductase cytochrome c-type subunit